MNRAIYHNQREAIYILADGCCEICKKYLESFWVKPPKNPYFKQQPKQFRVINGHFHHKIPLWIGGEDKKNNLQLLCIDCHKLVHKSMPFDLYLNMELTSAQRR
jgi:5-methylcytosine-specific restriction endonuclease McrA